MFTGNDVTKYRHGWPGNCKNVPGIACSVEGGKAVVIHLSRWFLMVNRTYDGKLIVYEAITL